MASSTPRVLLLGGHGKVSMLMTPLLLARAWHVTSVIRNPAHEEEIRALARQNGHSAEQLDVLVESLEDVKGIDDAQRVLDKTKPDYVIWSAGAGGKGGAERTFAVDRDAAKAYISAATSTKIISKFLMVSYLGSRRERPSWWTDEDWKASLEVNNGALKNYFEAKVSADEWLVAHARKRGKGFRAINLRPGTLTDDPAAGIVSLGHTRSRGKISRADVADVAVRLLETKDADGYYDLLDGEESVKDAVERVIRDGIDCFEGEDSERIYKLAQ